MTATTWFDGLLSLLAIMGLYTLLLFVARKLKDHLTPYRLTEQLGIRDNPAVGLALIGYLLAVTLIFIGVHMGPSAGSLLEDLLIMAGYSLLGLLFLTLSRWSLDHLMFKKFGNLAAIVEQRSMGMAMVRFGVYVATGLVAAASLAGSGGGVLSAVVFFLLGQGVLILFTRLYDLATPYDLQQEVSAGNTAAGIAFGGSIMALGLIIAKGIFGDFVSWSRSLLEFAEVVILGIVLLLLVRQIIDFLLMPGHDLDKEIVEDRNVAAGLLELGGSLCFALVLAALL
ncbi:MAG: DUF350 domain-containing protein [Magnetococcales bacterium]|nr:DUF350 domain-containing protein [Magnetococcales bacterium]